MQAEKWRVGLEGEEGLNEGREAMGWRDAERGKGSLCGFESAVQLLPDKLLFPGTPQENSARKRITQCTNLSEVILNTSLSTVLVSCLGTEALGKSMPKQYIQMSKSWFD